MISFYLLWTACYFVMLIWLEIKWPMESPNPVFGTFAPKVTLLIPLRNERKNLEALILQIRKIAYPELQILLIDDQSEDDTFSILTENLKHDSRVQVLQSSGIGKKAALEFGVEHAQAAFILCSDADCSFPEDWVTRLAIPFSDPKIQLVCGPVMTDCQQTYFQRFQQIEWASILLLTQFFFLRKKPLMCSGANLAYRKSAFLQVKGYDQNRDHTSGDDEFLLKKIVAQYGGESCVYLPFYQNIVMTQAQPDPSALLSQRVRWAGKWRMHRDVTHTFSAVLAGWIQLIWIASLGLLGFGFLGFLVFGAVWIGKIWGERSALGKVLGSLDLKHSNLDFVKTSLLHPFYVLTVAVGAVRGKFVWKGREN